MPYSSWLGLLIVVFSQAAVFVRLEPFWTWHTPIAWTGYIVFVDGIVFRRRGSSWLTTNRREFVFLALISIPLWVVFEGYNLLIRNWHYVNLHESLLVRYFGYAWAFATISPGIFQTAELVAALRGSQPTRVRESHNGEAGTRLLSGESRLSPVDCLLVGVGAAMLILPIVWPSPYLAAPVFLGFILLLDPINALAGDEALLADARAGHFDRGINLLVAGAVCGGLWEFWNYWARTKWVYTVPIVGDIKIFEMPVLGYFGFPPFALECFAMYIFVRRLLWPGKRREIGL